MIESKYQTKNKKVIEIEVIDFNKNENLVQSTQTLLDLEI